MRVADDRYICQVVLKLLDSVADAFLSTFMQ
jgi:hypothetical protein